MSTGQAL